jgi:hypothetical protein
MQFPFLAGASLSSFDIQQIFEQAPKEVVSEERAQGKVAFVYPKGSPKNTGTEDEQGQMDRQYRKYTDHLQELWREQGGEGSYEEWLAEHCSKWCCWQETWLSELRQLRKGHLFVFVTPELDYTHEHYKHENWLNDQSFEAKFKSTKYTEGEEIWGKSAMAFCKALEKKGSQGQARVEALILGSGRVSGRALCKHQCFDPSLGFADEGWGFEEGEEALGILDWERRHLASVSKKHGLQTVFIINAMSTDQGVIMVQVVRPLWYLYDGLEAPLGTFVFSSQGRMMPPGCGYEVVVSRLPSVYPFGEGEEAGLYLDDGDY